MGECPTFVHAWWPYKYACELARAHMCSTEKQHKPRGVERNSPEMRNLRRGNESSVYEHVAPQKVTT